MACGIPKVRKTSARWRGAHMQVTQDLQRESFVVVSQVCRLGVAQGYCGMARTYARCTQDIDWGDMGVDKGIEKWFKRYQETPFHHLRV